MLSILLCRNQGSSHFGRRLISSSRIAAGGQDDPTVSYLVHSCGLSPEAAIEASHKVKLRSLEKADSVLALFRRYEFSDTQISDLVRRHPRLLLVANAQKTLLPKLEFLSSICQGSTLLKQLVTELGMPSNCIAYLLKSHTRIVTKKLEEFGQIVSNVKGMGFGSRKILFVQAMGALSMKKTAWRVKEQVYKRWGWSESDIRSAFRMLPLCMLVSEEKIMGVMEFLVNTMRWKSGEVAEYLYVLSYSLEKRIIPRCSVIRVLLLKGLIEEEYFLSSNSGLTVWNLWCYWEKWQGVCHDFKGAFIVMNNEICDSQQSKCVLHCHSYWFYGLSKRLKPCSEKMQ
ncbi:hypothetical protein ACLB2K_062598 [Fragaria x ananassa]